MVNPRRPEHDWTDGVLARARRLEEEVFSTLTPVGLAVVKAGRRSKKVQKLKVDRHGKIQLALEAEKDAGNKQIYKDGLAKLEEARQICWRVAHRWKGLAYKVAKSGEDRFQMALIGVYEAAKRFDPTRGIRFSTYAQWWARAKVTRYTDDDVAVRVSHGKKEKLRNLSKLEAAGIPRAQILDMAGVSDEEYERLRSARAVSGAQSLDALLRDDEERVPWEPSYERDEEKLVSDALTVERLLGEIDALPPRLRTVLRLRYGLHGEDEDPQDLRQIGHHLGLSRERVRQLELSALTQIRKNLRLTGLPPVEGFGHRKVEGRRRRAHHRLNDIRDLVASAEAGELALHLVEEMLDPLAEDLSEPEPVVEPASIEPEPTPVEPELVVEPAVSPDPEALLLPVATSYAPGMADTERAWGTKGTSPRADQVYEALSRRRGWVSVGELSKDLSLRPSIVGPSLLVLRRQGRAKHNGSIAKGSRWRCLPICETEEDEVRVRVRLPEVTLDPMDRRADGRRDGVRVREPRGGRGVRPRDAAEVGRWSMGDGRRAG